MPSQRYTSHNLSYNVDTILVGKKLISFRLKKASVLIQICIIHYNVCTFRDWYRKQKKRIDLLFLFKHRRQKFS
jgi:hypothetical protein